ncbi:uroporphyrinogen-III synthase [Pseudidiomarina planktonica]|nr:uroporphyrinogen-III synthase [Pseudidiomarina planktonica]RUO64058.1 uroporphyrinogen-III synthase [Pseudidiomarina planktonica]
MMHLDTEAQVLLLRAPTATSALRERLERAGINTLTESFVDIIDNPSAADQVADIASTNWHGGIVISQNAASYAAKLLSNANQTWPQIPWFSVGPASARVTARYTGLPVTSPWQQHNSEGLLKLPELQQLVQQNWLIIRGEGGRELLADTLTARGAKLRYWSVYQRAQKHVDGHKLWQAAQKVRVIVVTSAEQLGYFLAAMPQEALSWLEQCSWVVPGERIAGLLPFRRNDNVHTAGSAVDHAIANSVMALYKLPGTSTADAHNAPA